MAIKLAKRVCMLQLLRVARTIGAPNKVGWSRMEISTSLTQGDVDLLFQVEHGCHEAIALDVAGWFVPRGFLRPMQDEESTRSLTSIGVDGRRIYLDLTLEGRTFLAAVRDGMNGFREWKPV